MWTVPKTSVCESPLQIIIAQIQIWRLATSHSTSYLYYLEATQTLWVCVHWLHTRLQFVRSSEGYHELHGDSKNTIVRYSCCVHSHSYKLYLIQDMHKFQITKSIGNWFLNALIPAGYFPFNGMSHCMAVILYECTFQSSLAIWAEDFDSSPWTFNWQKDFLGLVSI
jgi:hypothetical protein